MRKYLLTAAAAMAVVATPAMATNNGSPYVGIEGGVLFPQNTSVRLNVTSGTDSFNYDPAYRIHSKTGFDIDGIVGYDLGMFRLEGELGYKQANIDSINDVSPTLLTDLGGVVGGPVTADDIAIDGHTTVWSGMVNGLIDFGGNGSFGAYAGGGVGYANVKLGDESDADSRGGFAWQLIAGAYAPISSNIDIGLKYRYFETSRLDFVNDYSIDGTAFSTNENGKFRSHSLLASLVFNFGGTAAPMMEAPPPPPPPPAPETQTCPDGSVIPMTSACPAPPPPPPPPPPAPVERGERGQ